MQAVYWLLPALMLVFMGVSAWIAKGFRASRREKRLVWAGACLQPLLRQGQALSHAAGYTFVLAFIVTLSIELGLWQLAVVHQPCSPECPNLPLTLELVAGLGHPVAAWCLLPVHGRHMERQRLLPATQVQVRTPHPAPQP